MSSVVIPDSVTTLGLNAFANCDILEKASLSQELYNSITFSDVFSYCKLKEEDLTILKDSIFKATGKTATVKAKKLKKSAVTLAASSLYNFTPKTAIVAVKSSGKANFTVNKTNGNITIKKKTKKGTYKISVKVMSLGNADYKASDYKTVTVTIKVK